MQITPICLSCAKPDIEDLACTAYPKGIPWRILHGAGCAAFLQNPDAPTLYRVSPEPDKAEKTAI